MSLCDSIAAMVAIVRDELDCDRALDLLVIELIKATDSRNGMIARVNDEQGTLELRHGAGVDWTLAALNEEIQVQAKGQGIIARVAATGQSFVTGDVSNEPQYRNMFDTSRSEAAIPIKDRHGRTRAVLNIESDRADWFDVGELRLCEVAGALASLALDRDQMRIHEEALVRIGNAIGNAVDEDDLIDQVLQVADEVLLFQACSIFLFDAESGQYLLRGTIGLLKNDVGKVGYAPGEGCTGSVCQSGTSMLLNDPQNHVNWLARHVELPGEEIASFLAVPIVFRGKSIGAIRVLRRKASNPFIDNQFTLEDLRVLEGISEQFASGLEGIRSIQKIVKVERMAAWGELSAKSSHMIGNRVFALKGDVNELGHLLEENPPEISEIKAIHRSLGVSVIRIEEILQDFRDFVSATKLEMTLGDINELVEEAVREVFPRRSSVALRFDLERDLPPVEMDPRKLRRAISEVIENSLSFFETGKLSIVSRLAPDSTVKLRRLPATKRFVQIEIEDEGPGVNSDLKERIFEPFYSSRPRGMGLGLSIVKGILEAHGGTVFEDGASGGGARFVMLLPAAERP